MPGIPRADILRHATAIAATLPLPADWPAKGRAWPEGRVLDQLKRAGWPTHRTEALLPSATAAPSAVHKPYVRQPVAVVPREWLEALAERLGCDLSDICRGLIADE